MLVNVGLSHYLSALIQSKLTIDYQCAVLYSQCSLDQWGTLSDMASELVLI